MKPVAGWRGLPAARSAVVHGAHEPAYELDPGRPEHPRLCHGPIGPGARLLEFPGGTPHAGSSMEEDAMQVLYSRCAGLDVHKDTVVGSVATFGVGCKPPARWLGSGHITQQSRTARQ